MLAIKLNSATQTTPSKLINNNQIQIQHNLSITFYESMANLVAPFIILPNMLIAFSWQDADSLHTQNQ